MELPGVLEWKYQLCTQPRETDIKRSLLGAKESINKPTYLITQKAISHVRDWKTCESIREIGERPECYY